MKGKSFYDAEHVQEINQVQPFRVFTQNELIRALFDSDRKKLSPWQVYSVINKNRIYRIPITSIRRALNQLTQKDLLIRHKQTRIGRYGHKEHYWSKMPDQLNLF